jgi:hypothetical protein
VDTGWSDASKGDVRHGEVAVRVTAAEIDYVPLRDGQESLSKESDFYSICGSRTRMPPAARAIRVLW